jgi:hypothetical protein
VLAVALCYVVCFQAPALLQVLQDSLAQPGDIFLVNFGRWHFHNCIGLLADSYTQSLAQLGAFYQVGRQGTPAADPPCSWLTAAAIIKLCYTAG